MSNLDALRTQADQFRASGALGKPGVLSRLFEYLLERSASGQAPKEMEIAYEVFAKDGRFDVSQDSIVRVYMHKLRKRLDDYYTSAPAPRGERIVIPKGKYLLTLTQATTESTCGAPGAPPLLRARSRPFATLFFILASACVGAAATFVWMLERHDDGPLNEVRSSALWAPLLADDLPINIVVGDYYLLAETDESNNIRRLTREFFINSKDDLVREVEADPTRMARYRNLNLTYLPTSAAFALRDILPILGTKKSVRVVLMSDLDGNMLASSHIIYVGLFSGLGILADPTLAASRLSIGATYDDIIDTQTSTKYFSTAGDTSEPRYVDYGFVSTYPGPGKNRIVVIAGARDTGVTYAADAASSASSLDAIGSTADLGTSFESLHEVHGVARAGMNGRLLFASSREASSIWAMRGLAD